MSLRFVGREEAVGVGFGGLAVVEGAVRRLDRALEKAVVVGFGGRVVMRFMGRGAP